MTDRWALGRMQNPIRGFLHGGAAVFAVAGSALLVVISESWTMRIAASVFGIAMVALFATSSLYHSIPWNRLWKKRVQRVDHSMIYTFIAATYTPAVIVVLDTPWRLMMLAFVWAIALAGIGQHVFFPTERTGYSVGLATTMGWIGLLLLWPFVQRVGIGAFALTVLGGLLYTVGMVFLVTNWPKLWPRVFSYHEAFHVLVVLAAVTHFLVLARYVVPLG